MTKTSKRHKSQSSYIDTRLSKFRDTCCYCYHSIHNGLTICTCGLSFCPTHIKHHLFLDICSKFYNVVLKNNEIKVDMCDVNEGSKASVRKEHNENGGYKCNGVPTDVMAVDDKANQADCLGESNEMNGNVASIKKSPGAENGVDREVAFDEMAKASIQDDIKNEVANKKQSFDGNLTAEDHTASEEKEKLDVCKHNAKQDNSDIDIMTDSNHDFCTDIPDLASFSQPNISKLLEHRISLILQCKSPEENVRIKEDEIECPHVYEEDMQPIKIPVAARCADCDLETNLWVCFTCGYIGCGRVQYGVDGNGHAMAHSKLCKHGIFVFIESISVEGTCDTYCYNCDNFIINTFIESKFFSGMADSGIGMIPALGIKDKNADADGGSNIFVGIKNAGNTCYISSVLQMIGYALVLEGINFSEHFENCRNRNPLSCFLCQLMKVFNKFRDGHINQCQAPISIMDLLKVIWSEMPQFSRDTQHDAHEFMIILIEKLKMEEKHKLIPKITPIFRFEIETNITCDTCNYKNNTTEADYILYTQLSPSVKKSVKSFFDDERIDCSCGGTKVKKFILLLLPKYLLVTVGRVAFLENEAVKLHDKIEVDYVDLESYTVNMADKRFMDEFGSVSPKIVDELKNSGRNRENVLRKYGFRETTKYNIMGCITHTGKTMNSGHYTWWAYTANGCFLVNDQKVTESDVEMLEHSYLMLFH